MADGIAVRAPVLGAVAWMREYVDAMPLVDEKDCRRALRTVRDALGLILEPSGAVGIAAALRHKLRAGSLGTILCARGTPIDCRRLPSELGTRQGTQDASIHPIGHGMDPGDDTRHTCTRRLASPQ
ncbi:MULTISPECIES: pyridoxal-phosphate dependent enzyme [Streptomyces]|uniref:pyridoxal-phosphate dependent enzyme n=1 Tax=Streptomyces TaxID=1883 RepID=UPI000690FD68|nr:MULTISPECIES: pyridoxal-phosphate dependent enzyme [Streptomyces]